MVVFWGSAGAGPSPSQEETEEDQKGQRRVTAEGNRDTAKEAVPFSAFPSAQIFLGLAGDDDDDDDDDIG